MKPLYSTSKKRRVMQWVYSLVTLTVLLLGWKFPILGFVVLVAMVGGMISGPLAGRWFCGNLCPRGGLLELIIAKYSPNKPVPVWLISPKVRWGVVVFLFAMMILNGIRNPSSWQHWGFVFWTICFITTIAGTILAIFWNSRAWCSICPMGTLQNFLGGSLYPITIEHSKCKKCFLCEKKCPMKLKIVTLSKADNDFQHITSRDCIKCGECIAACPADALTFKQK